jgi:hypothetical protein
MSMQTGSLISSIGSDPIGERAKKPKIYCQVGYDESGGRVKVMLRDRAHLGREGNTGSAGPCTQGTTSQHMCPNGVCIYAPGGSIAYSRVTLAALHKFH